MSEKRSVFVINEATCSRCGMPRGRCACGTTRNRGLTVPDFPGDGQHLRDLVHHGGPFRFMEICIRLPCRWGP